MRYVKWVAAAALAAGATAVPAHAGTFLCVPATAGQAITSGGAAGTCATGSSSVQLPSAAADQQKLISLLPYLSLQASGVGGKPTVRVSGANLQIVNGTGSTTSTVNGTGNLQIGYNESGGSVTGSHGLVLGINEKVEGTGQLVMGSSNTASRWATSALVSGWQNTAGGSDSVALGGAKNTASSGYSTVIGGEYNRTYAEYAAVTGGRQNQATRMFAFVAGGCGNSAGPMVVAASNLYPCWGQPPTNTADDVNGRHGPSVFGGWRNEATGTASTIVGGNSNVASAMNSSIAAGIARTVTRVGGVNRNTHAVRVGPSDDNLDRSTRDTAIRTWSYADSAWINTPDIDVRRCTVSATPVGSGAGKSVVVGETGYKDWILLRRYENGQPARFTVDVSIHCID